MITITDGTGSVTKGTLSGSGTTWTISVSGVTQGDVKVSVASFGAFNVTNGARIVAVYAAGTTYDVTDGADGNWSKGSDDGYAITIDANSFEVTGVTVDGVAIAPEYYTVTNDPISGKAVVTLSASCLETLSAGDHDVRIILADGYAHTKVTVSEEGGGSNTLLIVAVIAAVLIAICVGAIVLLKAKKT
jgi:hypothetical protein